MVRQTAFKCLLCIPVNFFFLVEWEPVRLKVRDLQIPGVTEWGNGVLVDVYGPLKKLKMMATILRGLDVKTVQEVTLHFISSFFSMSILNHVLFLGDLHNRRSRGGGHYCN